MVCVVDDRYNILLLLLLYPKALEALTCRYPALAVRVPAQLLSMRGSRALTEIITTYPRAQGPQGPQAFNHILARNIARYLVIDLLF